MRENCANCRFWSLGKSEGEKKSGKCRVRPPTLNHSYVDYLAKKRDVSYELEIAAIAHGDEFAWQFPVVSGADWCGEWQAENRPINTEAGNRYQWAGEPLEKLGLSVRAKRCLEAIGITSVGLLIAHEINYFTERRRLTRPVLNEIISQVTLHGLSFKDQPNG